MFFYNSIEQAEPSMKFLIFLASFLALTAALDEGFTTIRHTLKTYRLSAQEIRKYEPAFASGRIINGFPVTSDTRFPFVTDNLVTWPDQTQNICTGSILSASWTISARQCMLWVESRWKSREFGLKWILLLAATFVTLLLRLWKWGRGQLAGLESGLLCLWVEFMVFDWNFPKIEF